MDVFADKLGRVGAWAGQNKYLGAIKNAFQSFMPATIAGAIGVLWTNVLVNDTIVDGTPQGLGGLFEPIMVLEPLNSVFSAIQFCTISCISVGIVMLVASEIGAANGEKGVFPAILGLLSFLVITPNAHDVTGLALTDASGNAAGTIADKIGDLTAATFSGFQADYLGATGLFTALIIGILALEIYNFFRKREGLKIKMPDQVPPGVARAFEVLIPTFLTLLVVGMLGWLVQMLTGQYVNDVIKTAVQEPLVNLIGGNIWGVCAIYLVAQLFWLVGIHGANMVTPIKETIFRPMLVANTLAYTNHQEIPNIFTLTSLNMFAECTGSGCTMGLIVAIFLFGKREDNRAIASLSLIPGLFNINETVTFGVPMVLNPILGIPFVLVPVITVGVGYILTSIGFCPPVVIEVPWTMPPLLYGFIATGANIMGAVSQLIVVAIAIVGYIPFLIAYEKYQNKMSNEAQ